LTQITPKPTMASEKISTQALSNDQALDSGSGDGVGFSVPEL